MAQVWLDRDECRRDGDLPPVCMVCGSEAGCYLNRTFSWSPPWLVVLILFGVLGIVLWVILASVMTKKLKVFVPLCEEHRTYFSRRQAVGALVMFGGFLVMVGGIAIAFILDEQKHEWAALPGFGGLILFLVSLFAGAILLSRGVKPTEILDFEIRLTGVSDEFADAVRDQRRAKKAARDQRRAERGDEDDRRPRRRSRYEDE